MTDERIDPLEERDPLMIAGRSFSSRLIVGTGKYRSHEETVEAIRASGGRWSP